MNLEELKQPEKFPQKIVKNTIYNIIGNFTLITIGFILVPYIIKHIGVNVYGSIWVIAIIVISFSQLFDFGLTSACTKYIAEYHTKSDVQNMNRVVNTVFFFFLIFWVLVYPLIYIFREEIILLLGTSSDLKSEMYFVLFVVTAIMAVNHITSPFYASISAIQRYDLLNIFIISAAILNIILIVILFNTGFGVNGLAISYFIFYFSIAVSVILYCFKLIPGLQFGLKYLNIDTFKKVFYFGINLQIGKISQIVVFQLDKFLALKLFGGKYAAFYEVGSKITSFTRSIPLLLVSAIVPAATELDAKGENLKLKILFETGTRYLIIGGFLIGGFIFSHADLIIQSWIGKKLTIEGIYISSSIIRLIVLGYFANMITGAMSSIALGFDRTEFERRAGIVTIILFPLLAIILLPIFGFYGIAMSVSLTLVISSIYFMLLFVRFIDYKIYNVFKMLLIPISAAILSAILTYVLYKFIPESYMENRISSLIVTGILFLIYLILFSGSFVILKGYTNTDLIIIKMFIDKLKTIKTRI